MKKRIIQILSMLICILFIFAGCSTPAEPEQQITESTTVLYDTEQEIIVSDEVKALAEDTIDAVENDESIETDIVISDAIADEDTIEDELAIEQDAQVAQENVSYNGTNTGKGTYLLGGCNGPTYFSQLDPDWANKMYSNHGDKTQTMKSSACGPTSAAMVVSSSKGSILPTTMANLFVDNGYRTYSNGTAWSAWSFVADFFDFNDYCSTSSYSTMKNYISQDKNKDGLPDYYVVVSVDYGLFTTGGHYIVIIDYNKSTDTYTVYDPYNYTGKFNTASRKAANVKTSGNDIYVTASSFLKYANAKNYWCFSNDYTKPTSNTSSSTSTPTTVTKYVKTNGGVLNVRKGPGTNYSIVSTLKNGTKISVYETKNGWSRIASSQWVSNDYLSSSAPTTTSKVTVVYVYIPATGRYAYCKYSDISDGRLKSDTTLYSNSNLTGTKYSYLAKTKVTIKKTL